MLSSVGKIFSAHDYVGFGYPPSVQLRVLVRRSEIVWVVILDYDRKVVKLNLFKFMHRAIVSIY